MCHVVSCFAVRINVLTKRRVKRSLFFLLSISFDEQIPNVGIVWLARLVGGNADLTRDKRTLLPPVIRPSNYLLRLTPLGDILGGRACK